MNRPGIADLPVKFLSRSLTRRTLLLGLIGAMGLGSTIVLVFLITLNQIQDRMDRINVEAVNVFDRFFLDIQSDLRATGDGLAARDDQNLALLALWTRNSAFLDLFFVNPDGTILIQRNAVGRPKQTKIEQLAWLESPPTFGKVVIGPVRFEGENSYVDMAITATDDIGLPAGLLLARVDLIELWNTTLDIKVGDSGYAYITDNTGQLVAFHNRRLLETGSKLQKLVGRTPQAIAESRLSFFTGLNGELVLASAQPLQTVPWFAVVEQPAYEALAPFMIPAFVLLLALMIVGLLLYNTIRFTFVRIVSPLLVLRNAVGQMADGQLNQSVEIRHNDELGQLTHSFNRMADQLHQAFVDLESQIDALSQAQAALRESEQKFRGIVEQASDGIVLTDEHGNVVEWNHTQEHITGLSAGDVIGQPLWDIQFQVSTPDRDTSSLKEQIKASISECLQTGQAPWLNQLSEQDIQHKDGTRRIVQTKVFPIKIRTGFLLSSIIRDITEIKQAEEALRQSEEKFSKAFQLSPLIVVITRIRDGYLIEVNESFEKITGYPREEALGHTTIELGLLVNPAERERLLPIILANGKMRNEEILFRTKSGEVITCLFFGDLIELNGEKCLLATFENITERKKAEETIRESEEKFRRLFETSRDFLYITNLDGEIIDVNKAASTLSGYSADELKKINIQELYLNPNDRGLMVKEISERGFVENLEVKGKKKDGTVVDALVNSTVIKDDNGNLVGFQGSIKDITERRRAEEQLRQSEEALRKAQQVAHVGSWAWHIQENRLEWSDEMYRIFGIEKESFTGDMADVIVRTIHPDDRAAVEQSNLSIIHKEKPLPLEYHIVWPDGTVRTVWAEAGELILGAEGKPQVLTGIVADITERKQAEEALQYQNRLQELLMEISTKYINIPLESVESAIRVSLGELAEFVGADRAYIIDYDFHKQVAINTHEWCGKGIKSQIVELQAVPLTIIPEWAEVHHRGEPMYIPDVLSLPPGVGRDKLEQQNVKSLLAVPLMNSGVCIGSVGFDSVKQQHAYSDNELRLLTIFANMLVNVRRRKLAEDSLRESEERFKTMSSMTSEGIMIHEGGIILDTNQAFAELTGCSNPDNLIGMNGLDAVPLTPESRQRILPTLGADFTETFEIELVKSDGSVLPAETSAKKITYRGRQASLVSMRDITERKRAEEALLRDADRSKALARIAARLNASLELKDVLNAVCEQVARVLEAPVTMIWLADEELQASQIQASYGLPAEIYEQIQSVPSRLHPLFQQVLENIYYVPNIQEVLDNPNLPLFHKAGLHTVMVCLFYHEGHFIGILSVFRKEVGFQFSEADVTLLNTLSNQITIAIYNAQLYEQVKAGRERLQYMSEKLVNIQEAERRHLAIELHDEIGQALIHIKMSLDRFDPAYPEKGNLESAREMILDLMNRVRGLSLELRPTILDDLGLLPAVLWHIERFTTLTGIQVDFKHNGMERRFRAQVESTAYRILQESLTNIYRHAGATLVTVSLWADDVRLGLQVEDNGVGFDPASALQEMTGGLSGMRERTNVCGGQLLIDSRLTHGTYISLELPLQDIYVERRTR
jgi:PAS domain S-box-containing protein